MLTTVLVFLLVLGFLVFIHEFGHFLMAKRAGVRVEAFAFGFGPRLIGWKRGDTDYRICPIPLGGYVKMLGEDPKDDGGPQEGSYASKSVWARFKIIVAGPLMNLALPFLLMPLVYMIGIQEPAYLDQPAVVGWVDPASPGEQAGFRPGDRILRIQGQEIPSWERAKILFAANPDRELSVEVLRDGNELTLDITPVGAGHEGGVTGLMHIIPPVVGGLTPNMPAERAGLLAGDRILAIDGEPILEWAQMSSIIRASPEEPLVMEIRRGEQLLSLVVTPILDEETEGGLIGIAPEQALILRQYGFFKAVQNGFAHVGKTFALTFYVLGKLVIGDLSIKTLGGPILIAKMTGDAARVGLSNLIWFTAFLSLNLGILNLLPIPVLDGGHLVFLTLEAIRRKPVNVKVREVAQQVGFFLLLGFILVISYNDVLRVLPMDLGDLFK